MIIKKYIMRKPYVSPSVSFEEVEDDVLMWAKSADTTLETKNQDKDDEEDEDLNAPDLGAKETTFDFVFQYE